MPRLVERRRTTLTGESAATPSPVNATPTSPVAAVPRQTPIRRTAEIPGLRPVATPPVPAPTPPTPAPEPEVTTPRKIQGGFAGGKNAFAVKFPQTSTARAWGAFNPLAPLKTEGVSGIKSFLPPKGAPLKMRGGRMLAVTTLLAQVLGGAIPDDVESQVQIYKDLGYPDDVAQDAAEAYNNAYKAGAGTAGLFDIAAQDAQVAAGFAAGGAIVGSIVPGFGTLAGAGIGWALGTTLAGFSNMLMLAEQGLKIFAPKDAAISMNGTWIDLPTFNDFMPGISGIVGEDNYYGAVANTAGAFAADNAIAQKYPNRFNGADYVYRELTRLDSNYYATSSEVDPRAKEMYDLISQGYFVKQTPNGLGIDNKSYYEYLADTMMYRDMEDKKRFLPAGTTPFLNGGTMSEDQWYSLFGNAE